MVFTILSLLFDFFHSKYYFYFIMLDQDLLCAKSLPLKSGTLYLLLDLNGKASAFFIFRHQKTTSVSQPLGWLFEHISSQLFMLASQLAICSFELFLV